MRARVCLTIEFELWRPVPTAHGSRGEQATCNSSRSGPWSAQQKDGKLGTERHNILHTVKMGRDWPVKPTTYPQRREMSAFSTDKITFYAGISRG